MHESLTAIRDSGDFNLGNFLEKSFVLVIKSGGQRTGKHWEALESTGKEWTGINTLETHSPPPVNIPNNRHCIPGASHPVLPTMPLVRIV